jgi:putative DNA primase/helicase
MRHSHFRPTAQTVDLACGYAGIGWQVLPCHSIRPGSGACTCGQQSCRFPGKHPVATSQTLTSSAEVARVRQWWQDWPGANVAIRTGFVSKLCVLNVDLQLGGLSALHDLLGGYRLPETLIARTGSGGLHLYFDQPSPSMQINPTVVETPGLSVLADGNYVMAPPSIHANGSAYSWLSVAPIMAMPEWLCRPLANVRPDLETNRWAS